MLGGRPHHLLPYPAGTLFKETGTPRANEYLLCSTGDALYETLRERKLANATLTAVTLLRRYR
ncbi:hypothetical protein [Dendronalium sp. ChiSLP03b]|uniref:hypothetical protein n=1 Tax=Dendronalium sp. ChiSLP03b TaxID=3075381 RepID=UPI003918C662